MVRTKIFETIDDKLGNLNLFSNGSLSTVFSVLLVLVITLAMVASGVLLEALLFWWIAPVDWSYWFIVRWVIIFEIVTLAIVYKFKGGKN